MCLRFSFAASTEKMRRQFNLQLRHDLQKSYNIGAGQNAYVLTNEGLDLQILRWGLVPYWAKDEESGHNLINAKAETISTTPSFRLAIRQKRCIIFADSFYAWKRIGRQSQPFRVMYEDTSVLAFAGVWDAWVSPDKQVVRSFSVITTNANKEMRYLGQRMPVIFKTNQEMATWLEDVSLSTTLNMLKTLPDGSLGYYPVSADIDDLDNNYPEIQNPVDFPNFEKDS